MKKYNTRRNFMKKYSLLTAMSTLLVLFSGCNNVFTGSNFTAQTADFSEAESFTTGTSNLAPTTALSATFTISTPKIDSASSSSQVALTLESYTQLDENSIAKAFKFYTLKDNSTFKYGAPIRETQLSSSVKDVTTSISSGNATSKNVTTTVRFTVDTSSVETSAIALLADATVLKDKKGSLILNADNNDTCGEATDSYVKYIDVTLKADRTVTKPLHYIYKEDFCPTYPIAAITQTPSLSLESNAAIKVTTDDALYYDFSTGNAESRAATDLASTLATIYSIQVIKPGNSTWTDVSLNFAYDNKNETYVATTSQMEVGTRYRLVTKTPARSSALKENKNSTICYGHEAYSSYDTSAKTIYGTTETVELYSKSPSYIISPTIFAEGEYYYDSITSAQKSLFNVSGSNGLYSITYDNSILGGKLSSIDFIVTDRNYTKLSSIATLSDENTVKLQLENKYYTDDVYIWVGTGTTITQNSVNSTQKTFGIYKDVNYGDASGYIKIN